MVLLTKKVGNFSVFYNLRFRLAWFSLTTFTESITESSSNHFQMTHTTGSSGLSPLRLNRPIVWKWEILEHKNIGPSSDHRLWLNERIVCELTAMWKFNWTTHSDYTQFLFMVKRNLHERNLAAGYPHCEHVDFWIWYDDLPHRRHNVCVLLRRFPKLEVPFVCNRKSVVWVYTTHTADVEVMWKLMIFFPERCDCFFKRTKKFGKNSTLQTR